MSGEPLSLASDELQLLVLLFVAATSALIGTFLVLRKSTMLANALSHTILPGIVLAYLSYAYFFQEASFSYLLPSDSLLILAAFLSALVTTFLAQTLVTYLQLAEDSSIGMVFTLLFAFGIILVTAFTRSSHVGSELIMGNIDALHQDDLRFVFWIFVAASVIVLLFWRARILTSFDPLFAKMCGISNGAVNYLLMALCSLAAIAAFRAVGVLLFLAFLVTPTLIGRMLTHKLKPLAILSCLISILASLVGVAFSRHLLSLESIACSTAALIVTLLAFLYLSLYYYKFLVHNLAFIRGKRS